MTTCRLICTHDQGFRVLSGGLEIEKDNENNGLDFVWLKFKQPDIPDVVPNFLLQLYVLLSTLSPKTPAKPSFTSVKMLKLCGLFINAFSPFLRASPKFRHG